MAAGLEAGVARGLPWADALWLGAAVGALNVTRHGLATGERSAVDALAERIAVTAWEPSPRDAGWRRGLAAGQPFVWKAPG